MSDLISRQDAVKAIRNAEFCFTIKSDVNFANYRKTIQEIFDNVLDAQEKALMNLPSAQPEIIRCKDCKYYTPVTAHCEIRGKGLYLIRGMNDFCSRAERREDAEIY